MEQFINSWGKTGSFPVTEHLPERLRRWGRSSNMAASTSCTLERVGCFLIPSWPPHVRSVCVCRRRWDVLTCCRLSMTARASAISFWLTPHRLATFFWHLWWTFMLHSANKEQWETRFRDLDKNLWSCCLGLKCVMQLQLVSTFNYYNVDKGDFFLSLRFIRLFQS